MLWPLITWLILTLFLRLVLWFSYLWGFVIRFVIWFALFFCGCFNCGLFVVLLIFCLDSFGLAGVFVL